MNRMDELAGANIQKPVLKVEQGSLERIDSSLYRSRCPECKEGILMGQRDQRTFVLSKHDYCILCGQKFEYTDIDKMIVNDPIGRSRR